MGVHQLKQDLRDVPGIGSLTVTFLDGNQTYVFDRHAVTLKVSASDAEVKAAIRGAVASRGGVTEPEAAEVTAPVSTLPPVNVTEPVAVTIQPEGYSMSTPASPGAHALTIKDVLAEHSAKLDQILQGQIATLQATLSDQVQTVTAGTDAVISRAKANTDEFKAILGQFTNDLGTGS